MQKSKIDVERRLALLAKELSVVRAPMPPLLTRQDAERRLAALERTLRIYRRETT